MLQMLELTKPYWLVDVSGVWSQDYYKNNPIRYKAYRWNCGRDKRLKEIWGDKAKH